jgi:hypothetical protein
MQAVPFFRASGVRNYFNLLDKIGLKTYKNIRTKLKGVLKTKFLFGTPSSFYLEPPQERAAALARNF